MSIVTPGNDKNQEAAETLGYDHSDVKSDDRGEHHTIYTETERASWDYDSKGNYIEGSYHEKETKRD